MMGKVPKVPKVPKAGSFGSFGGFGDTSLESLPHIAVPDDRCAACVHVTRYGNCGEPVAAGLLEHFGLARHPDDGRGCVAFAARAHEPGGGPRAPAHFPIGAQHLGHRLAHLLAVGAINDVEAELVRERFDADSAVEWSLLLDWCAAAVRGAAPACEMAPFYADRVAAGRQVATDTEKRASGPISPACDESQSSAELALFD